jgi:hypothetical protein
MSDSEHCVICWAVIPEGRQFCPACERSVIKNANREGCGSAGNAPQSGGHEQGRNRPGIVRLLHGLALRIRLRRRGLHARVDQVNTIIVPAVNAINLIADVRNSLKAEEEKEQRKEE